MRTQANAVISLCLARADTKTKMYSDKDTQAGNRRQTHLGKEDLYCKTEESLNTLVEQQKIQKNQLQFS